MKAFFLSVATVAAIAMTACGGSQKADATEADSTGVVAADEITFVGEPVSELAAGDTIAMDSTQLTVVDFNAEWCAPCQQFKPVFHQVAKDYAAKARFISVNVDSCPDVATKYGVSSIPQITFIAPDGTVSSQVGSKTLDEFTTMVQTALGEE